MNGPGHVSVFLRVLLPAAAWDDPGAAVGAVGAPCAELLSQLGLPVELKLQWGLADPENPEAPKLAGGQRFALWWNERPIPYTPHVVDLLLHDPEAQRIDAAELGWAVASTLAVQAERLTLPEVVEAVLAGLDGESSAPSPVVAHHLSQLLDAGISLGDREALANLVSELSAGLDPTEVLERSVARLLPRALDLEFATGYGADLFPGMDEEWRSPAEAGLAEAGLESLTLLSDGAFRELGIRIPNPRVRVDAALPPGTFAVRLNHRRGPVVRGLAPNERLANHPPESLVEAGIDARAAPSPAGAGRYSIVDEADGAAAEAQGATLWEPLGFIILALMGETRRNAHALVDLDMVEAAILELDDVFEGISATAGVPGELERISRVLRDLLRDEVSILDLPLLLDAFGTFDSVVVDAADRIVADDRVVVPKRLEGPPGAELLRLRARRALRAPITQQLPGFGGPIGVHLLDPDSLERPLAGFLLDSAQGEPVEPAAREPLEMDRIRSAVRSAVGDRPVSRPVVITISEVAQFLGRALRRDFPELRVLSYEDLDPSARLLTLSRIGLPPAS